MEEFEVTVNLCCDFWVLAGGEFSSRALIVVKTYGRHPR